MRAEGWLLTGEAELKLKRFQPAQKAFESVVAIKSTESSVRFRALAGLGLAHEEQREWKQALAAYESVPARAATPRCAIGPASGPRPCVRA